MAAVLPKVDYYVCEHCKKPLIVGHYKTGICTALASYKFSIIETLIRDLDDITYIELDDLKQMSREDLLTIYAKDNYWRDRVLCSLHVNYQMEKFIQFTILVNPSEKNHIFAIILSRDMKSANEFTKNRNIKETLTHISLRFEDDRKYYMKFSCLENCINGIQNAKNEEKKSDK